MAIRARRRAYAPYSQFQVGAAVESRRGLVFTGCNVENASYGLTVCAERNAIAAMVASGERRASRIAIVVDHSTPVPPCGVCRQVLAEFGESDLIVRSRTLQGHEATFALSELLPFAFDGGFLTSTKRKKRR